MKILLVGPTTVRSSDIALMLARALRQIGCTVLFLDPANMSLAQRSLVKAGQATKWLRLWHSSRLVLNRAKEFQPEAVIIYGSNAHLLPSALHRMRKRYGAQIVLWEGNIQFWRWFQAEALQYYDHCFVLDSYLEPILAGPAQKASVHRLPPGCDPEEHRKIALAPEDKRRYGADIAFVGSAFPMRIQLFEQLADHDMRLWGKGWDRSKTLRSRFVDEPVYGLKKTKIYNASKIIINLQNSVSQIDGISCRIFEVLACGGFPLTEYKKDLDLYFDVGREIITFESVGELKTLIRYYLTHPEERQAITELGRQRVLEEHTYRHRAETIYNVLCNNGPPEAKSSRDPLGEAEKTSVT